LTDATTMKAIFAEQAGGPEVLAYKDVPVPAPGDGQVLIKVAAVGVNYADVYQRKGVYRTPPPCILGNEGAGTIIGFGPGAGRLAEGADVAFRGAEGGYAEFVCVPESWCYELPDGVPAEVGVTMQVQGMTAHFLADDVGKLEPGKSCLVHAGAGGVGQTLIQIAKLKGARVLSTVGGASKAERVKSIGADEVILYRDVDFVGAVLELTDGEGVDAVFDGVGATTIEGSIASAGFQGVVAWYGDASGPAPQLDARKLAPKCVALTRVGLQRFIPDWQTVARRCDDLAEWYRSGSLKFDIAPARPLSDAADVHRAMEARITTGKQILAP
jgi:NADPH2:quinone reductase